MGTYGEDLRTWRVSKRSARLRGGLLSREERDRKSRHPTKKRRVKPGKNVPRRPVARWQRVGEGRKNTANQERRLRGREGEKKKKPEHHLTGGGDGGRWGDRIDMTRNGDGYGRKRWEKFQLGGAKTSQLKKNWRRPGRKQYRRVSQVEEELFYSEAEGSKDVSSTAIEAEGRGGKPGEIVNRKMGKNFPKNKV